MQKKISIFLCLIMIFCTMPSIRAADSAQIDAVICDTADYLYKIVDNPTIGAIGGEWAILGLARSGVSIPEEYYQNYYRNVENHIKACNGVLHEKKYTEYARVVLALTAIGKDAQNVAGYNLVEPLLDYEKTVWQGLNGPIWALIALDSGDFGTQEIKNQYIDRILACEITGGGWALAETETTPDADVTAMALVALAEYRDRDPVMVAIDRGIGRLSAMQQENGGFISYNTENLESTAQVLTAISTLGISHQDARFVKNGNSLVDNLLSFQSEDDGFSHTKNEGTNLMATEQAFYALVSANRLEHNQRPLFDMTDSLQTADPETSNGLPGKHTDVIKTDIKYPGKTFSDIQNHQNQTAIEALSARGIINGMTDTAFAPDNTMTRAEFATIVVNSLGLPLKNAQKFTDIKKSDWFYGYVNTAYHYGIVSGISETEFNPKGTITRQEAAVMVARAAKLCGLHTDIELFSTKNILAEFVDYVTVSDWAVSAVAFCYQEGILDRNDLDIRPKTAALRGEVAQMLYQMLGKAELL